MAQAVDSRDPNAPGVLVAFEWAHSGAADVRITGSMAGWMGSGLPLAKSADGERWSVSLRLRPGQRVLYKFIVDGEWMYDPSKPFEADEYGNINNFMDVPGGDRAAAASEPAPALVTGGGGGAATPSMQSAPGTPYSAVHTVTHLHGRPHGGHGGGHAHAHSAAPGGGLPPARAHTINASAGSAAAAAYTTPAHAHVATGGAPVDLGFPHGTTIYAARAVKEHAEEYLIDVSSAAGAVGGKGRSGMTRSASVSDVSSLNREIAGGKGPLGGMLPLAGMARLGRLERGASITPRHASTPTASGSEPGGSRPGTPSNVGGGSGGVGSASTDGGFHADGAAVEPPPALMMLPRAGGYAGGRTPITAGGGADMDALSPLVEAPGAEDTTPKHGALTASPPLTDRSTGASAGLLGQPAPPSASSDFSFIDGGSGSSSALDADGGGGGAAAAVPLAVTGHLSHLQQHAAAASGSAVSTTAEAVYAASLQAQAAVQAALQHLQLQQQQQQLGGTALQISLPLSTASLSSTSTGSLGSGGMTAPVPVAAAVSGHHGGSALRPTSALSSPSHHASAGSLAHVPKSASTATVHSMAGGGHAGHHHSSAMSLASHGSVSSGHLPGMGGGGGSTPAGGAHGGVTLTNVQASLLREGKLVLAFVGAPATGKTFQARRLKRHLSWIGYKAEIFNVGNYRRKLLGANQPAEFFNPANEKGEAARREIAKIAFEEMVSALLGGTVDIAIFDATNTTRERRRWLKTSLKEQEAGTGVKFQLVFIESVCNDEAIIRANVRETKLKSPDYKDLPEDVAVTDFLARIKHYKSIYQPLSEEEEGDIPFIRLVDVGRLLVANRINGFLNSRIMFFLSNLHITARPIWLSRHGESEYNVQGRIGGDSLLSPRGVAYSHKLAAFMGKVYPKETSELVVWTSCLKRTQMTAGPIGRDIVQWKALDEIDAGICDGMTYEAIAATMPDEYAARARNKFTYRYPRGESYQDMVTRLEPVIIELMRQKDPVLIVSHQATLRVLYAYLTDKPPETCPEILFPLHTIIQITPKAYGAEEVRHEVM